MSTFAVDPILVEARAHAEAGAWHDVVGLLAPVADAYAGNGDLVTLYAQGLLRLGRPRDARQWLDRAEPALARSRQSSAHRTALNLLGAACFALGELADAEQVFEEALDLATIAGDLLITAHATNNLGAIANLRGDGQAALAYYTLAVPVYQRLGQPHGLAQTHHNIAITFRDLGEIGRADEQEQRALEFAGDGKAPRIAAMARVGRAELALRRGDARFAEVTARRAAEEFARLRDVGNEADARRLVGTAYLEQGRLAEARDAIARALAIADTHELALPRAEALRDRSHVAEAEGQFGAAVRDARAALEIFSRLRATAEIAALEDRLARLEGRC